MKTKSGLSLQSRVLLIAAINAALLGGAWIAFVRLQLSGDFGALLLGQSRMNILSVTRQLVDELPQTPLKDRTELLARYSATHGVSFYLFRADASVQEAGSPISLPDAVIQRLRSFQLPLAQRFGGVAVPEVPMVLQDSLFLTPAGQGYWVAVRIGLRSPEQPGFQPGILVLMSPRFFTNPFLFDSRPWLAMGVMVVLIALACWLPMMRGVTKAIGKMAAATGAIAKGKFSANTAVGRSDELGKLGDSINQMAAQLEGYVHGQKRFLRDAAHELRSPLGRMQAALAILERRSGPEDERLIRDLQEEIDLMSSLTGELLTFAREESKQREMELAPLSLSEAAARVLAAENPGEVADCRVEVDPDLRVIAHSESLFRGLSNVVRNAIRYAGDAGPITLAAHQRNGATVVTVSDQGPGIPDESLEMIFTPFYRLEVSRNRSTGGNGLGMSIARSSIEACQGTIYCRNGNPGLQVIITLRSS